MQVYILQTKIAKIKKCADQSPRTKTQTPIVAKLILMEIGINRTMPLSGICILSNSTKNIRKKAEKYPLQKRIPL